MAEAIKVALADGRELPRPGVLCTVAKVTGSGPSSFGTKMYVGSDRFVGTIGGGEFERLVLEHARGVLSGRGKSGLKEFALCRASGQCCGGRMEVLFEMMPKDKSLVIYGAGHVGRALAEILSGTPLRVSVVDARGQWARELPKDVETVLADPVGHAQARSWTSHDAAAIITHSHELDLELAKTLLQTKAGYLGMIGSEHKAEVFAARLGGELAQAWEARMKCPVGWRLEGKNPKLIALAIAAELLRDWWPN
ncbi:MAG: xanthine dehydrogenase accessory protein XdhC [Elusimicrobiota bacterium]